MSSKHHDDEKPKHTKGIKSTHSIQQVLTDIDNNIDENTLPDHLLHEGSIVKQSRQKERDNILLLESQLIHLQIQVMVEEAELKFRENEKYFKKMHQLEADELLLHYLQERYIAEDRHKVQLQNEEYASLKILQNNLLHVLTYLRINLATYTQQHKQLRNDIDAIKRTLPLLQTEYNDVLSQCFAGIASATHFKALTFPASEKMPSWDLVFTERDLEELGQQIASSLKKDLKASQNISVLISSETEKYLSAKINSQLEKFDNEASHHYLQQLIETPNLSDFKQTIVMQIEQRIQQNDAYSRLESMAEVITVMHSQLAIKESARDELEQKMAVMDKCRELLESMLVMNTQIAQDKVASQPLVEQTIKTSEKIIADVLAVCEIPQNSIELDEDLFNDADEELHPRSPGLR